MTALSLKWDFLYWQDDIITLNQGSKGNIFSFLIALSAAEIVCG